MLLPAFPCPGLPLHTETAKEEEARPQSNALQVIYMEDGKGKAMCVNGNNPELVGAQTTQSSHNCSIPPPGSPSRCERFQQLITFIQREKKFSELWFCFHVKKKILELFYC